MESGSELGNSRKLTLKLKPPPEQVSEAESHIEQDNNKEPGTSSPEMYVYRMGLSIAVGGLLVGLFGGWILGGLLGIMFLGLENARSWANAGVAIGVLFGPIVVLVLATTLQIRGGWFWSLIGVSFGIVTGLLIGDENNRFLLCLCFATICSYFIYVIAHSLKDS